MVLRSMAKIVAATAAFGVVHSALASSQAKLYAARTLGPRNRNGLYRVFFIGQSAIATALLIEYIRRLPSRDLYCIRGSAAALMHTAELGGLLHATSAARQVGVDRITGVRSFMQWLGDRPVSPEPEAQGPALDSEGLANPKGPFTASRHPLNFSPLPILWLWPRMTTSLLAFNAAATVYLVIGSKHEESRLCGAYGESFDAYRESGVPFYLPRVAVLRRGHTNSERVRPMTEDETFPITLQTRIVLCQSERDRFLLKRAQRIIDGEIGVENLVRQQVQEMIEPCHFYDLSIMALRLEPKLQDAINE
jgi:methanethiol S-methyltransferase